MRIPFLTAPEGVEQIELTDPWRAAVEAGHEPVLVSTEPGEVQAESFGGLVLPGGVASPDFLRMDERAVTFVQPSSSGDCRSPRSVTPRGRSSRRTSYVVGR